MMCIFASWSVISLFGTPLLTSCNRWMASCEPCCDHLARSLYCTYLSLSSLQASYRTYNLSRETSFVARRSFVRSRQTSTPNSLTQHTTQNNAPDEPNIALPPSITQWILNRLPYTKYHCEANDLVYISLVRVSLLDLIPARPVCQATACFAPLSLGRSPCKKYVERWVNSPNFWRPFLLRDHSKFEWAPLINCSSIHDIYVDIKFIIISRILIELWIRQEGRFWGGCRRSIYVGIVQKGSTYAICRTTNCRCGSLFTIIIL